MLIHRLLLCLCCLGVLSAATSPYPVVSDNDPSTTDGRPMLGVNMSPVPVPVQRDLNIRHDEGVYVRRIYGGTTADQIGIQKGDVIVDINGSQISSMSSVRSNIFSRKVGDQINVTVLRDGQKIELGGTLGGWPERIPVNQINASAEERYRSMQARRLAREAEHLEERKAQTAARLKALRDGMPDPAMERQRQRQQRSAHSDLERALLESDGRLPGQVMPDINIPELAAFLPPWRFTYSLLTEDPQLLEREAAEDPAVSSGHHAEIADEPPLIDYGFFSSTESI